jgi:hypothetical protein
MDIVRRIIDPVSIEYFFSNRFTHGFPRIPILFRLLTITATRIVQADYEEDRVNINFKIRARCVMCQMSGVNKKGFRCQTTRLRSIELQSPLLGASPRQDAVANRGQMTKDRKYSIR